jgi:GTP cyclohydrolase I
MKNDKPHSPAFGRDERKSVDQAAKPAVKPNGAPLLKSASPLSRPTREEAEAAVRTLILWAGDDPRREGLRDTPRRVVDSYAELFSGYGDDPEQLLDRTFSEVHGYDDIVMLRNMRLESHCEHHMLPIIGHAHVAYLPNDRVVGISKLARVVDAFSKRLQTQETMTAQIAEAIEQALKPRGVAVLVDAYHQCMTIRGVRKQDCATITTRFTGLFQESAEYRERFLRLANPGSGGRE